MFLTLNLDNPAQTWFFSVYEQTLDFFVSCDSGHLPVFRCFFAGFSLCFDVFASFLIVLYQLPNCETEGYVDEQTEGILDQVV